MRPSYSKPRAALVAGGLLSLFLPALAAGCERKQSPAVAMSSQRRAGDTSAVPYAAPVVAAPRVVFLGDSISAGLHLSLQESFPQLVSELLAEQGTPIQVSNAGVSGDTSAGGLHRVDWLLKQRPAVVVLELGGNDGLRGLPVAQTEQNLRTLLLRIREGGAQPLLLGMVLPPSYGAEYTRDFAALYERLAAELQVAFVPYFMEGVAGVPALNLEDGLHPTAEGQRMIAKKVAPALSSLLKQLRAQP